MRCAPSAFSDLVSLTRALGVVGLAAFAAAWFTATPAVAEPGDTGNVPAVHEVSKKTWSKFSFDVSLWEHYDDNILELSDQNIAIFDSGVYAPERFLITSIGAYITSLSGRARWRGKPWARHETRVAIAGEANWYANNSIKNYETYDLSVAQELTATKKHLSLIRLTVSHTPEYYQQQLRDAPFIPGSFIYESAGYRQTHYRLAYDQTFIEDRFDGRLTVEYRRRNYNQYFPERDNRRDTAAVSLGGRPIARSGFSIDGMAGLGKLLARGDLDSTTAFPEADISYDVSFLGLNATIPWGGKLGGRVALAADREIRTYTTTDPADTSHYDRVDHRLTWSAGIVQKLPVDLELFANYENKTQDTTFPRLVIAPNDTTSFVSNRVTLGLRWRASIGR